MRRRSTGSHRLDEKEHVEHGSEDKLAKLVKTAVCFLV